MIIKLRLNDIDQNWRPRERLVNQGVSNLSDAELLALIIRSGGKSNDVLKLSNQLLCDFKGLKNLANTDLQQLTLYTNIGTARATAIKAACEIGLRISMQKESIKIEINKPSDVYSLLRRDFYGKDKEHLYLLSLDSRNKLNDKNLISIGTINETLVHPKEIFRQALINNATSIIIVHNHPSGDVTPSDDDISVTNRIYKVGISMGIALVGHIIISNDSYSSLKALNLIRKEVNK